MLYTADFNISKFGRVAQNMYVFKLVFLLYVLMTYLCILILNFEMLCDIVFPYFSNFGQGLRSD